MNNPRTLAGSVVVAVAAVSAGLAISGPSSGSAIEAPRTLTLTTPFEGGKATEVDLGKKGLGSGDMVLTTDIPLRDEASGRRVAALDVVETILSAAHNGTVQMQGAIRLSDGRVEFAATLRHTDPVESMAIVGGTGAYANVRGEVTIREDERRKLNIMRVSLVP
jgi:hypothetical protein